MIRRNVGTILVATALVLLFLAALVLAQALHKLPLLALDLTEHLFGIILAVFVFERVLAWREERRWLGAKRWLYMILLEVIDDLLRQLLPATVPKEGEEPDGEVRVYEVTGERVQFGEVLAYGLLRLLVKPDDMDSAVTMRDEQLEEASCLGEESAQRKIREADHQLAFTTSIVVESVVSSAMKPKAWLEAQLHGREGGSSSEYLQVNNLTR